MPTRLVLIRHGMTDWNRQKRYCGYKDAGLNSLGRRQAGKLRKKLKNTRFDVIYTSDRKRAIQTAMIIFGSARIIKIKDLREMDFGALEGLTHSEAMKKWPVIYKKWLDNPLKNFIPGAERLGFFQKRVKGAIKKIVRFNRGKAIAIVCHGGTIRMLSGYIPAAATITIMEYQK